MHLSPVFMCEDAQEGRENKVEEKAEGTGKDLSKETTTALTAPRGVEQTG